MHDSQPNPTQPLKPHPFSCFYPHPLTPFSLSPSSPLPPFPGETHWTLPGELPPGYVADLDPFTGRLFYIDTASGLSQWTRPERLVNASPSSISPAVDRLRRRTSITPTPRCLPLPSPYPLYHLSHSSHPISFFSHPQTLSLPFPPPLTPFTPSASRRSSLSNPTSAHSSRSHSPAGSSNFTSVSSQRKRRGSYVSAHGHSPVLFEFDDSGDQRATHGFTGAELALVPEPTSRRTHSHSHSYNPANSLTTGLLPHSRERESNLSRSPSQWSNLTGDDDDDDDDDDLNNHSNSNSNLALDESNSRVPSDGPIDDDDDEDGGDFAITRTVYLPLGSTAFDAPQTATNTTMATGAPLSGALDYTDPDDSHDHDHDASAALLQTREQETRARLALASTQRSDMTTSPSISRLRWSPFLEQLRYTSDLDDDEEDEDEEEEEEEDGFTVTRVMTNASYAPTTRTQPTNTAQKQGLVPGKVKLGRRGDENDEEEDDNDGFAITHVINNNRTSARQSQLSPVQPPPQPLSAGDNEDDDGGFAITRVTNTNRQPPSSQRPSANNDDEDDGFAITHTTRQRPYSPTSPAATAIIKNDDVSSTAKGRQTQTLNSSSIHLILSVYL